MLSKLYRILDRPYPPVEPGYKSLLTAGLTGLFVGLFLAFFQPFNLDALSDNWKTLKILLYGLITFVGMIIFFEVLPRLFPNMMMEQKWKIKHQVLLLFLMIFLIATLNGLYTNFLTGQPFSWKNYLLMISYTLGVVSIPIIGLTIWNQNKILKQHLQEAQSLNHKIENTILPPGEQLVEIPLSSNSDKVLTIVIDQLIFIEATGNYVNLLEKDKDSFKKRFYRITLKQLELSLSPHQIIRCHKSFMVNLNQVKTITGNAQGLRLGFDIADLVVPVSRKYVEIIKSHLSQKMD